MNTIFNTSRFCLSINKELFRAISRGKVIQCAHYSDDKAERTAPGPTQDVEVPENVHPHKDKYITSFQKANGEVYDIKPFKIRLKPDKEYFWCLCGRSHSQPLCDGNHRDAYKKTPLRPVRFKVKEEKEYWLCNCKQTRLRPFCDGTHKTVPQKKK